MFTQSVIVSICFLLFISISGCTSESDVVWDELYKKDPLAFKRELESQPSLVQQNIWLSILATYPEEAAGICPKLTDKTAKQTCIRYLERPHLQTISPTSTVYWTGGALGERTVFPRDYIPMTSELIPVTLNESCLLNTVCLQVEAERYALEDWKKAGYVCTRMSEPLASADCLFHIAETLPVHVDNYHAASKLCALSGGFGGECHNHVLLQYASKMYDREDWHQQLVMKFTELYPQDYAKALIDVYWSVVAFRVVGMEYPLDTARFLGWSSDFQPYLRSIVALRMWEEPNALQQSKRALKGELMRVAKARGPNAPRFTPVEKWSVRDGSMTWGRFCDLRGGHRPVHENADIDLAWALLTAFAMSDTFEEARWQEVYDSLGQEHWEVRWAMARLLSNINKESALYQRLKTDTDSRVLQALY